MFTRILAAPLAVFIMACSLYLWREIYGYSDWAVLCLLPLGVLLLVSQIAILREDYRARMLLTLRAGSRLTRYLTGRLSSLAGAVGFVALSIPVLAWQALNLTLPEAGLVIATCMASGWVFLLIERRLSRSFNAPFGRAYAMRLSSWLCAALACPVIVWFSWTYTKYPAEYLTADFLGAIQLGMAELPARRGVLAEIMAPFYAVQGAKIWFVAHHQEHVWLTIWPSLDAALFGFLATRASILLTDLAEHMLLPNPDAAATGETA